MKPELWAQATLEAIIFGNLEPKEALQRLKAALKRRDQEKLFPRVLRSMQRLLERLAHAQGRLIVASEKALKQAQKELGEVVQEVPVEIDPRLIGGYVLEKDGKVVDSSYKRSLLELYRRIIAE